MQHPSHNSKKPKTYAWSYMRVVSIKVKPWAQPRRHNVRVTQRGTYQMLLDPPLAHEIDKNVPVKRNL